VNEGLRQRLPQRMFEIFAGGGAASSRAGPCVAIMVVSIVQINGNIINMGLAGSARNEFAARFGAVSGTYGKRVMIVLWVFVGLIAAALCQGADRLADPDLAWGALSRRLLGPGLVGFMLVGLMAANMASIASKTMAISALYVRNLHPTGGARLGGRREVLVGQVAGALALAGSVAAALVMSETMAVTKFILTINLPFGAAVLLMFFWRRLTQAAVWWCVLLTGGLIFVLPLCARLAGHATFSAEDWVLARAGMPMAGLGPGGQLAARFFFDAVFPFVVLVVASLLTRPPRQETVVGFFGKMKTPVGETRELDDEAMDETRRCPARFDQTKLFPGSSLEFTKWDRTDTVGFLACCATSISIVCVLWFLLGRLR
jgi:solute:Na+ symporter, SSS family